MPRPFQNLEVSATLRPYTNPIADAHSRTRTPCRRTRSPLRGSCRCPPHHWARFLSKASAAPWTNQAEILEPEVRQSGTHKGLARRRSTRSAPHRVEFQRPQLARRQQSDRDRFSRPGLRSLPNLPLEKPRESDQLLPG